MVKKVEEYQYSTAHYFLNEESISTCLQNSYIVQNYQNDKEEIKAFLYSQMDSSVLQKLKRAV